MKNDFKYTARSIYCCGRHFQVLWQSATNPKDRLTIDGKNSAKCRANLLAGIERTELQFRMCQCIRCEFCDHNGRVSNSTPYWAQYVSSVEKNQLNFTAPPFKSLESAKI